MAENEEERGRTLASERGKGGGGQVAIKEVANRLESIMTYAASEGLHEVC